MNHLPAGAWRAPSPARRAPSPAGLTMVLITALAGCVSPPDRVDRSAEKHAATDPSAMLHVAQAADQSNNPATAAVFYRRALDLDPANATAALGLAHALAEQGRGQDAVDALAAALPRSDAQDSVRLRRALGDLLILSHRSTEAVAIFREGLKKMPDNIALLVGLGVALDNSRDHAGAQTAYRQALSIAPSSVAARNDLALSTALSGDTHTAIDSLVRLRAEAVADGRSADDLATIDGNLALVYALQGNLGAARRSGAGAIHTPADLAGNVRFYSALAPGNGAVDSRGLSAAPGE